MNQAFLAALAKKGEKKLGEVKSKKLPSPSKSIDPRKLAKNVPEGLPEYIGDSDNKGVLEVRIDVDVQASRLDVYFSGKPSEYILGKLRAAKYHWHPARKCWYHFDSDEHREQLRLWFGAQFAEDTQPDEVSKEDTCAVLSFGAEQLANAVIEAEEKPAIELCASADFLRYREQCDALITHLNIPAADLMIVAVAALYENTFSN